MPRRRFPTMPLLLALASVSIASCGGTQRRAEIEFLPQPPADAFRREAEPVMPTEARDSDAAYEAAISDKIDWGRRADVTLWRSCRWVNSFLAVKIDCGKPPAD